MSAHLPGTSEPTSSASPSTRAPPSVASSSARRADSATGLCARARAATIAVRSSSKRSNDGVDAGLSVAIPTAIPASSSSASGATPQPRMPFERGQWATPTPCCGEQRDLLVVDVDAVRGHQAGAEQTRRRRAAGSPVVAGRRHEHLGERRPVAGAVDEQRPLGGALGEVRRRSAGRARRTPRTRRGAGVRRVRRDAERTRSERTGSTRSRFRSNRSSAVASLAEHLEVDDRPQPRRRGRLGGGAREAAVADRRDARAEALAARRSVAIARMSSRSSAACARCGVRSTARTAARRRIRRRPRTRCVCGS